MITAGYIVFMFGSVVLGATARDVEDLVTRGIATLLIITGLWLHFA